MKPHFIITALLALLLSSCDSTAWRAGYESNRVTLSYDDFGPEHIASQLLGPRNGHTLVIAYHGFNHLTPSAPDGARYVNILNAMNFLRSQVRALPPVPANEPLRQRLRATYARLYVPHRRRYDSMLATSFIPSPRGGRRLILPALLPPSI